MSIRLRLTLWYSAILATTLLLFGFSLYFLLSALSMNQYKQNLTEHAEKVQQRIAYGISLSLRGIDFDIQLDAVDHFLSKEIYLQVINIYNPQDLKRSSNARQDNIYIPFSQETIDLALKRVAHFETNQIHGHTFLIYNRPLIYNNHVVGVLQAATYTGELLNNFKYLFIPLALVTVALAFLFGWFMAHKALKPIDVLIEAAGRIEKGDDLEQRIQYDGPNDEIGRLTHTINGMLARLEATYKELEESYKAQRRFVSDASHELRTPLTTIRGNIDLLEKIWSDEQRSGPAMTEEEKRQLSLEAILDIAQEAERMSRLVNDLLSLARADAGYVMEKEWIPILPIVSETARKAQFLERKVEWRVGSLDALEGMMVYGNADYLQQMLFIFIENAFKYTEEGYVSLKAVKENDQIGIQIADTGIGMDEEEVPHIFDRFYRADVSRGKTAGTGLGLAIAKWIIDEHGGSIEVMTQKGRGTTFVIWLPAALSINEQT